MQDEATPAAKFQRFEKVLLRTEGHSELRGVVIWRDYTRFSAYDRGFKNPPRRWAEWMYSVYFPDRDRCQTLEESRLHPTGEFDPEESHSGKRFEVSFDTAPVGDTGAEEGCYRLPGQFWEVFVFVKTDVSDLRHTLVTWPSGITGVQFEVPRSAVLDRGYVIRAMSEVFAAGTCAVVYGPDSLLLK
jgi:hypothetical protein